MARLATKELEAGLQEFLEGGHAPQNTGWNRNWAWVQNSALEVGMRIAVKFDRRTDRALASVAITETSHNPRGCKGKVHVKGEANNINGCYDFAARTQVML
jgi:hypothetical protein